MINDPTPYTEEQMIRQFVKLIGIDPETFQNLLEAGFIKTSQIKLFLACYDLAGPLCSMDYTQMEKNNYLRNRYNLSMSTIHKLTSRYSKIYKYAKRVQVRS